MDGRRDGRTDERTDGHVADETAVQLRSNTDLQLSWCMYDVSVKSEVDQ